MGKIHNADSCYSDGSIRCNMNEKPSTHHGLMSLSETILATIADLQSIAC